MSSWVVTTVGNRPTFCRDRMDNLANNPRVVRVKVLEAHKILMGLNESNREAFHDLVNALERH